MNTLGEGDGAADAPGAAEPSPVLNDTELALRTAERDARYAATLFLQLLESSSDGIWLRDAEGRFQIANPAAAAILGGTPDEIIGMRMEDVWGEEFAAELSRQSEQLFEGGKAVTVEEQVFDRSRNGPAVYLSNKVPLFNPDGSRLGILGVSRDITDLKRTEDELRRSKDQLASQVAELNALYGSAPIGLAFFDREHRFVRINQELADINGVPVADHIGQTIGHVLPNAPAVTPYIDQVFATGEPIRNIEVSGQTPLRPGVERYWLTGFYPVHRPDGTVEAVGIWVVEISERKAAEQREHLLAREVDHRAKNLLAVVQSIVQLSRAETVQEFKDGLTGRIQSLARAHSLLADSRWDGVELTHLVSEELAPFSTADRSRISFAGPPVLMRPAAAQSLALVLHELATNAAKHGALAASGGRLKLDWTMEQADGVAMIHLDWVESGGRLSSPPEEGSGFGSRLITASVERQLRGKVERRWLGEGLHCTLSIPVSAAVVPAPEDPAQVG